MVAARRSGLLLKMAGSYVLVTAAAAAIAELVLFLWVLPAATSTATVRTQLQTTAVTSAKPVAVLARQLGMLPGPAQLRLGVDHTDLGPGDARLNRSVYQIPYVSTTLPGQGAMSAELLVAADGTVVNSSYPARYPAGQPVGVDLPFLAATPDPAYGKDKTVGGTVFWAANPIVPAGGASIGYIYVQVPVTAADQPVNTQLTAVLHTAPWLLATMVPVGLLFGLLSTWRLRSRLRRLAEATDRIAAGERDPRLSVHGHDEVSRLEAGFIQMAARLEDALAAERDAATTSARATERNRITRELHDSISQDLFSLRMLAGGLCRALPEGSAPRTQASMMESTAAAAMAEMRAMLAELRPVALEGSGLLTALTELAQAFYARLGMPVSTDLLDQLQFTALELAPRVEHVALRVAQEAVGNAVRHANARAVTVRLSAREGWAVLEIEDDGSGFDPAHASSRSGFGLQVMRERAAEVGGTLEVRSVPDRAGPGRGTLIRARLPGGAP